MNTRELVHLMTDGRTSINAIEDLLVQCGHDHDEIMEVICEIAESPEFSRRTIRTPYHFNDENGGFDTELDELVFYRA